MVVQDPAKLKLLSEPTKQRILAEFIEPSTPLSVAKKLGLNGKGIYRHIDQLIEAGFLFVVSTRPTRGTVERTLQSSAKQYMGQVGDNSNPGVWGDLLEELMANASRGDALRMMGKAMMRMSSEDWPKLVEDFAKMLEKYETDSGDLHSVHLVVLPVEES